MPRPPRPLTSACAAAVLALAIAPWGCTPAFAEASDGTITVEVDVDANGSGEFEDGVDRPQEGIEITVTDVGGTVVHGVTDADGRYVLKGSDELTGGRYFVVADIPPALGLEPVPASDTFDPLSTTVDVTSEEQSVRFGVAEPAMAAETSTPDVPTPATDSAPAPSPAPPAPTVATPAETAPTLFAVGGLVWQDRNRQGTQDDGELPADTTSVQLLDANGEVQSATVTHDGRYRFAGLLAGTYSIKFSGITDNSRFSPTGVGDASQDSDPDSSGLTPPFTLDVGAPEVRATTGADRAGADYENATIDAGVAPLRYAVGSQVWQDTSGDGIQQPGEPAGQARVTLLAPHSDDELATTETDAAGRFLFDDLGQGKYRLRFSDLGVHRQLTSAHVGSNPAVDSDPDPRSRTTEIFTLGQSSTELVPARDFGPVEADLVDATLNAGVVGSYTISNRVWNDENGDGLLSPGEAGIPGVVVKVLDVAGAVVATTTTDAGGRYEFSSLPAGQYRLKFSRRDGLHFTATGAGGDRTADSDVYLDGLTAPITVGEGHPVENAVAAGLTAAATTASSTAPTTAAEPPSASSAAENRPGLSLTGGLPVAVPLVGGVLLLAGAALVWYARRRS